MPGAGFGLAWLQAARLNGREGLRRSGGGLRLSRRWECVFPGT